MENYGKSLDEFDFFSDYTHAGIGYRFGRDTFQEAMKLVSTNHINEIDWSTFKYMVFDTPNHNTLTFGQRFAILGNDFLRLISVISTYLSCIENRYGKGVHRYIDVAPYELCTSISQMEKFFQDVLDNKGEGIILRDPNSPYKVGRSRGYLKHKVFSQATRVLYF